MDAKKKRLIFIGIAVLAVVAIVAGFLLANQDQPVAAGEIVVVTVKANSFEDMYGYQFNLVYDQSEMEHIEDAAYTLMDEISFVFPKERVGGTVLVGGTLVGDVSGLSGRNKNVCEVHFISKKDGMLSDFDISLERVNVVKSDMEYLEDLEGWTFSLSTRPADGASGGEEEIEEAA